jgi:carboxypeptidase C (cathepsin A)
MLFSVWDCFFQPATGAHAQHDPKTPPYTLNGAGLLNASNRSITHHSLETDNKKINYTAIAGSITVRGEQSEPIGRIFYISCYVRQKGLHRLIRNNISLNVYHGGHMPYLHRKSLYAMFEDAERFYSTSKQSFIQHILLRKRQFETNYYPEV